MGDIPTVVAAGFPSCGWKKLDVKLENPKTPSFHPVAFLKKSEMCSSDVEDKVSKKKQFARGTCEKNTIFP